MERRLPGLGLRAEGAVVNPTKLCEIEDFSDPDLAQVVRRLSSGTGGPAVAPGQRPWLVAMAVLALTGSEAMPDGARVITVGAGVEPVLSMLAERVGDVSGAEWSDIARLGYPDEAFDAAVCGPIEGVGDLATVSGAAAAIGRVLKIGGVLSLSTRFRLHGPPGAVGWPGNALLLSADELHRYVVEPSGLALVGDLQEHVSDGTMSARRDLRAAASGDVVVTGPDQAAGPVVTAGGYVFTMAHLLLRKTKAVSYTHLTLPTIYSV